MGKSNRESYSNYTPTTAVFIHTNLNSHFANMVSHTDIVSPMKSILSLLRITYVYLDVCYVCIHIQMFGTGLVLVIGIGWSLFLFGFFTLGFVKPGNLSFSVALKVCVELVDFRVGREVHGQGKFSGLGLWMGMGLAGVLRWNVMWI